MGVESIDLRLCNGCGICVEDCPVEVFKMDSTSGKAYLAYPDDCGECDACKLCPDICPAGAIDFSLDSGKNLFFPY